MLFDTHVHLLSDKFDEDREAVIAALPENGIGLVLEAGCDVDCSQDCVALCEKYDIFYGSAGIHPHDAKGYKDGDMEKLERMLQHPKMKAVGEIGLDHHYDFSPRDIQKQVFEMQLELAVKTRKPVIIHSREAAKETMDLLCLYYKKLAGGVMHCFSGSVETAKQYLDMGFYISFSGSVTFTNAVTPKEVAAMVPLDRMFVETDCPYLTPVPHRGKRNEPKYVRHVAEEVARIKGLSFEEIENATYHNGKRFFGIKN